MVVLKTLSTPEIGYNVFKVPLDMGVVWFIIAAPPKAALGLSGPPGNQ